MRAIFVIMALLMLVGCPGPTDRLRVLSPKGLPVANARVTPLGYSTEFIERTSEDGVVIPTRWFPDSHRTLRVESANFGCQELMCTETENCWQLGKLELLPVVPVAITVSEGIDIPGELEFRRKLITYNSDAVYRWGVFRCPLTAGVHRGPCVQPGAVSMTLRSADPRVFRLRVAGNGPEAFLLRELPGRPLRLRTVDAKGSPRAGVKLKLKGHGGSAGGNDFSAKIELTCQSDSSGNLELLTAERFHGVRFETPQGGWSQEVAAPKSSWKEGAAVDFGDVVVGGAQ